MPAPSRVLREYVRLAATASTMMRSPYSPHERLVIAAMHELRSQLAATATVEAERQLVSVVLPVYERADIVSRAILSVLTQTHRRVQLVVVDDGSSDDLASVVARFDDPRLTFVALPENRGHAAARNRGLQAATGDFVAYIDSDDWWDADLVRVLLTVLLDRNAAFAYSAQRVLRPFSPEQPRRRELIRFSPYNRSLLENNNYISMISVMHRREAALEVGGFDESFRRYSDWNFFLRLAERFPPIAVPVVLSIYDQGTAGSVSTTEHRQQARAHLRDTLAQTSLVAAGLAIPPTTSEATRSLVASAFAAPEAPATAPPPRAVPERATTIVVIRQGMGRGTDADLELCLAALQAFTPAPAVEVVVADVDEGAHTLDVVRDVVDHEQPDDLVVLRSDMLVTPGWLGALHQVLARHPDAAVVAPRRVVFPNDPRAAAHVPGVNAEFECDITLSRADDNVLDPAFDPALALYELSGTSLDAVLVRGGSLPAILSQADSYGDGVPAFSGDRWRQLGWKVLYTPSAKIYRLPSRGSA
jgi:O-antigen biosynthesis protein